MSLFVKVSWKRDAHVLTFLQLNDTMFSSFCSLLFRPKKKRVVFQVPCQKKTGSVGRLYFFFFFFFFLDSHRSSVMLVP